MLACLVVFSALSSFAAYSPLAPYPDALARPAPPRIGRRLLHGPFFSGAKDEAGYVIGSLSAISYFSGRIPQLIKNHLRGTCEGVSILMFRLLFFLSSISPPHSAAQVRPHRAGEPDIRAVRPPRG